MSELTHFTKSGDAHMVDVGDKADSSRTARASGMISMQPKTLEAIHAGNHKKGDVLGIARIAGIMAAKQTSQLIPLCHPLPLSGITLDFSLSDATSEAAVICHATVKTHGKTGVEMEALTAVNIALLTIYDMCKAIDKGMIINQIQLEEKIGGKSGHWQRAHDA